MNIYLDDTNALVWYQKALLMLKLKLRWFLFILKKLSLLAELTILRNSVRPEYFLKHFDSGQNLAMIGVEFTQFEIMVCNYTQFWRNLSKKLSYLMQ